LLANTAIIFIPIVNFDGYKEISTIYDSTGKFPLIRKNRHKYPSQSNCKNGSEGIGVDLNRNYGFMFGVDDIGSSPDPCDLAYRGPFAFSEPET